MKSCFKYAIMQSVGVLRELNQKERKRLEKVLEVRKGGADGLHESLITVENQYSAIVIQLYKFCKEHFPRQPIDLRDPRVLAHPYLLVFAQLYNHKMLLLQNRRVQATARRKKDLKQALKSDELFFIELQSIDYI